jgi:hypothetical protein
MPPSETAYQEALVSQSIAKKKRSVKAQKEAGANILTSILKRADFI